MKQLLLSVLSLTVISGCGPTQPKLDGGVHVSGTLFLSGSPLEGAAISFHPEGGTGQTSAAFSGADGKFTVTTKLPGDGMMPGNYIVTVIKTEDKSPPMTEEERDRYASTHGGNYPEAVIEYVTDRKYSNPKTSDLKVTVPAGGSKDLRIDVP